MGTYTTNYNLFMPTVGETGWGTLVNGNFTTIDTTMKSLSNRITAVENEVNGNLSCTSVTTSGKVTANGGISTKALTGTTGTFSGAVTAASFNGQTIGTNSFNGMPIGINFNYTTYSTSTIPGGYMWYVMGSNTYQYYINNHCGYIERGQKSLYVPRLMFDNDSHPHLSGAINNISLPSNIVAQLRITTNGGFYTFTYSTSGAFTKSGTIGTNTTYINLTNAEVNAWCKKGFTLTTNGAQNGSTVACALYYTGSTANQYYLYITD